MPEPDLQRLICLTDYEREAALVLAEGAHSYLAGGAADETTLRDNLAAWGRLAIVPRVLVGVGTRDPSVELLGQRRPHPVLVAPTAFQSFAHPEAEIATARGAAATDTIMCLSTLGTTSPEALAEAVPEGPRWFQLYWWSPSTYRCSGSVIANCGPRFTARPPSRWRAWPQPASRATSRPPVPAPWSIRI
jgi:isopentenyl diphosphate isomerase/L-lactate dehydrogenase-like FMN-dependent dehydrogenase